MDEDAPPTRPPLAAMTETDRASDPLARPLIVHDVAGADTSYRPASRGRRPRDRQLPLRESGDLAQPHG